MQLIYIDLFAGAGGVTTGIEREASVCPLCKSKEVSVKPITYDCYECGATWQNERQRWWYG